MNAVLTSVARGEITTLDVVRNQRARLEAAHETTNCVAAWNPEAEDEVADLDERFEREGALGPLHGMPITVKDWIDVAGLPCTGGELAHRDRAPVRDATVVARLRTAGAIVLAKTTVQVESELWGPVRNPIDPTRSPGASSSGEAAAVGGGGSLLGIGSDSGGSLRVPAAWCGVATLKPSAGRVPTTGHFPRVGERMDGRTIIGPMSTSVRALGDVLAIVAGPDGVDAGVPPVTLNDRDAVVLEGLRVGWSVGEGGHAVTPDISGAVMAAATSLEALGATNVGTIDQRLDEALDITLRYWKRASGRLEGWDVEAHLADWDRYRTRMLRAHAEVDVVVMPVTATPAPLHRPMETLDYLFTFPASLTGAPSVVVPTGTSAGLPVAVQVVAHRWRDDLALRAAAAIEQQRILPSSRNDSAM
ncbi:MAG: amidase [Acidimicrobiia bacterium]